MKNQKGEVVTGVMVVMMAGMMVFGMIFMHGDHGDRKDQHVKNEQKQEHSEMGPQHMHHSDAEKAPTPDEQENK